MKNKHPLSWHHAHEEGVNPLPHEGSHTQGQHAHDGIIKYPRDHRDTVAANRHMDSRPAGKGI